MNSFTNLINHTIRHDHLLKKICAPLKNHLGISIYTYYSIDSEGHHVILSTYPEQIEFFYSEKLYLYQPYLSHPSLFRSGETFFKATYDEQGLQKSRDQYQLEELFLILEKNPTQIEGFAFAANFRCDPRFYLENRDLLKKFNFYFKREAHSLIQDMREEKYSLKKAKGNSFFNLGIDISLSMQNQAAKRFLSSILPLSKREQECVDLYKQGHSAQSTAALLELSPRTVEHYLENIKNKLNLSSKRDLLYL